MAFAFNPITGKLDLVGSGGSATTDASLLTSGTLADARLSSNVSLDNLNNNFTVGQSITAPANTSALTASYSVTGANTTPIVSLTGTWNTTGIANGIRLDITDTASAATSRLLDLQVGGTSRFSVRKDGLLYAFNITSPHGVSVSSNADGSNQTASFNGGGLTVPSGASVSWTNVASGFGANDTILRRDTAGTLALRNGGTAASPVPQNFRVYNWGDTTNFERGFMRWNGNVLEIGTEAGGTGTANRSVRLLIGTQGTGVVFSPAGSGVDVNARSFTTGGGGSFVGATLGGVTNINYATGASDPTTTTLTTGNWQVYRNTTSGTIRLWANNNGTLVSVALA
jgi:hypothetical protein